MVVEFPAEVAISTVAGGLEAIVTYPVVSIPPRRRISANRFPRVSCLWNLFYLSREILGKKRGIILDTSQNLFLFGGRGVGKSTLLKALFPTKGTLWIDLLNYKQETRLSRCS